MSIQGTRLRLQAVNASIEGVQAAPSAFPGALNTADLPLALTWPGPGEAQHLDVASFRRQDRTYFVRLYVTGINQGQGKHEVWERCEALLQRFIEAYLSSEHVAQDNDGAQVTIRGDVQDGGLQILTYPPGLPLDAAPAYYGIELRVRTYEKW